MGLIITAHLFLVSVQQDLKGDALALTISQDRCLSQAVLPRPVFNEEAALEMSRQIQRADPGAYLSHRKRTLQRRGVA